MRKAALHNLGCKVNAYETEAMGQLLKHAGYEIVPFEEKADVYVINTCSVTNIADRKSRQMLHRAKKKNPNAVVVAVGCYVQTGQDTLEKDGAVDLAIGNNRKKDLVEILEAYLESRQADGPAESEQGERAGAAADREEAADGMCGAERADREEASGRTERDAPQVVIETVDIARAPYEEMTLKTTAEHTRAYIKIQDGCNQFCSYCIIPYARGRVRSRMEEDILKEARGMAEAGYREVVLTGIHISSYGVDRGGSELVRLLERLSAIKGIERIRLGSLEPGIVTEEFAAEICALSKVCPHFHLSLQSGSDTVLRRMNRRYDSAGYLEAVEKLRKYYVNPAITTDVIVGFPGETEEEFEITRQFVETIGFYEMHIFKYSRRQGTRAAMMEGQLTEAEKGRRSAVLAQAEEEMSRSYRAGWLNRETGVLFEEKKQVAGGTYWIGHTPQYVKVAMEAGENADLSGQIVRGTPVGFLTEDILLLK